MTSSSCAGGIVAGFCIALLLLLVSAGLAVVSVFQVLKSLRTKVHRLDASCQEHS